jgi:phospholipase C
MEHFLSHKTGKKIRSAEVTNWRRAVSGDLTSVFRPYNGEKIEAPAPVERIPFLEGIHKAQFKDMPSGYKLLTAEEVAQINTDRFASPYMPQQEKGTRSSCALPYELYSEGKLSADKKQFTVRLSAKKDIFGAKAIGAPFNIYTPSKDEAPRNYAVLAGDSLTDSWTLDENGDYHLAVYGPNGFFREFKGNTEDPAAEVACEYQQGSAGRKNLSGNIVIKIKNNSSSKSTFTVTDNAYKAAPQTKTVNPGAVASIVVDLKNSSGWYDVSIKAEGYNSFEKRYAGRVETGRHSISDPVMGRVI